MKLIDTHCHLYDDIVPNEEFERIINETEELSLVILMGTDYNKSKENVEFCSKNSKAVTCVGLHPENIDENWKEELEKIEKLISNEKVVGIGEIGLDYHFRSDNKEEQKTVLIEQLKMAKKHNLPVCIHNRDSAEDLFEILRKNKDLISAGCVIHCFSETSEWAKRFVETGCNISFCGNFTFKNYDQAVAKVIPLEKLMVETDSPYLSPVPYRGQKNNPSRVICVAERLAKEKDVSLEKMAKITLENSIKFYNLNRFIK